MFGFITIRRLVYGCMGAHGCLSQPSVCIIHSGRRSSAEEDIPQVLLEVLPNYVPMFVNIPRSFGFGVLSCCGARRSRKDMLTC